MRKNCEKLMCELEIKNKKDFRKWAVVNHPDKFQATERKAQPPPIWSKL